MHYAFRPIVRATSSTIGLAREAYLYNKEKKEARKVADAVSEDEEDIHVQVSDEQARDLISKGHAVLGTDSEIHPGETGDENIEREWELDEEASDPPHDQDKEDRKTAHGVTQLAQEVIQCAPARPTRRSPLAFPVIIPQRRPRTRVRGFVRAYAPDLDVCGISQESFLLFLQNFDKASEASPWLKAIYTSAAVVGFIPGSITFAVSIAVQVAAATAIELEGRYNANRYLDQVNKELFMPRGLYAMVMRYRPQMAVPGETKSASKPSTWRRPRPWLDGCQEKQALRRLG
ncbi:hypothetical protein VTN77DRAFT_4962 [Rasamsonia byssochlamydoides]|uniref:uncharacterized protein n=1 Tax=Rasamsonia byssochlamydoides TaxID=89139 RepID=UPI0037444226